VSSPRFSGISWPIAFAAVVEKEQGLEMQQEEEQVEK